MPDVFINYRTGDGNEIAVLIERELSRRFGDGAVFRDTSSIQPGRPYPEELIQNVRRCAVMISVIGPDWTSHPGLHDENDWVRKEIVEALACGIPIIPVLDGRRDGYLKPADLPAALERLAEFQGVWLDPRDVGPGLDKLAKALTQQVPELHDRTAAESASTDRDRGAMRNRMSDVHGGTNVQGRNITGGVASISGAQIHIGRGNNQHFSGPGATFVAGDMHGDISQRFGDSGENEGDDR